MDIDCDGANSHGGNCGYDESIQDQTSFKDLVVSQYGIPDLDANIHPYVVFGNTDYDPQRDGMWPLSVMVVVCGNQLVSGPLRRSGLLCKGGDGLLMRRDHTSFMESGAIRLGGVGRERRRLRWLSCVFLMMG